MIPKINLTSFENASILRKFSILYFVMSILPLGVLYYFFLQLRQHGMVIISEDQFSVVLTFVVLGVAVGFFSFRKLLADLVNVTNKNAMTLVEMLGSNTPAEGKAADSNEIIMLTQSFNEITSHLEENIRNLDLAKRTLQAVLARVSEGIATLENIDNFLLLIIETLTSALDAQEGFLFLLKADTSTMKLKTTHGKKIDVRGFQNIELSRTFLQEVVDSRQTSVFSRVQKNDPLASLISGQAMASPLLLHEAVIGVLVVSGKKTEAPFTHEEAELIFNIGLQTAVAIENSRLNASAERTYFEIISALALAVEAKDPFSRGHLDRVSDLVVRVAQRLDVPAGDLDLLRDAAKLHDIGKIGVVDRVLVKPGPLTQDEMEMMKKHTEIGEGIIRPIASLHRLCDIIRHHHEKLDGSGYPDGLEGEEINLLTRILAVVDIYDALTSARPYRAAFTREQALSHLRDLRQKIDQRVVGALAEVV